jgi:hypothetical protein
MQAVALGGLKDLKDGAYFRRLAERTRQRALMILQLNVRKTLSDLALDYDELADDLDGGDVEIRHPELLPQKLF